jgi:hypothetical protein
LRSAHTIEIYVKQAGKKGLGAATTLPFRVVDVVDEETGEVAPAGDLANAVSEQVGRREAQETEQSVPAPNFLPDWEGRIRDTFAELGVPEADLEKSTVWSKDGPPTVVMYFLSGDGLLLPNMFEGALNGVQKLFPEKGVDQPDGIFYRTAFTDGDTFAPRMAGVPVVLSDGSPLSITLKAGNVYVVPVLYLNGRWTVVTE